MGFIELFQHYILKKRYIYSMNNLELKTIKNENISIKKIDSDLYNEYKRFLTQNISSKRVCSRISNENMVGLLALDHRTKKPLGYFWGIKANKPIWHDQFLIPQGDGFLLNGYVDSNYRGQGIFQLLIYRTTMFLKELECKHVFDVVESLNLPSVIAHDKIGAKIHYKNYLIKLWKRNIFSILVNKNERRYRIYYTFNKQRLMQSI